MSPDFPFVKRNIKTCIITFIKLTLKSLKKNQFDFKDNLKTSR